MYIRYSAVQGSFYPETAAESQQMILSFKNSLADCGKTIPRALIVPHAGWIYSGRTAATAYSFLSNFKGKRVIILAPSHHAGFVGLSAGEYDAYLIHNNRIAVDLDYLALLKDKYDFDFYEQAHKYEHSDEVQLPFLEYYLSGYKILSLLYSYESSQKMVPVLKEVLADPDNLLLISSDLSHYHQQIEANKIDQQILDGVLNSDLVKINQGEACGKTGILAMVQAAMDLNLEVKLLDYRTSGDESGDLSKVVGYASFIYYE